MRKDLKIKFVPLCATCIPQTSSLVFIYIKKGNIY